MNDSILTTLVLSSTLVAILSVLFDFIMYARSEKLGHIFRTQTMKDIKESSLASRSISLIIGVLLLVLWVLTQGVLARVADSFLVFSGIDTILLRIALILSSILITFVFLALFSEFLLIFYKKTLEKKDVEEHQNPV